MRPRRRIYQGAVGECVRETSSGNQIMKCTIERTTKDIIQRHCYVYSITSKAGETSYSWQLAAADGTNRGPGKLVQDRPQGHGHAKQGLGADSECGCCPPRCLNLIRYSMGHAFSEEKRMMAQYLETTVDLICRAGFN